MAIPTVNPCTTQSGTLLIKFPSLRKHIRITRAPAITPRAGIAAIPYEPITGISTTVIAPVGPLT
ncbi:unannotated protein [freshwater metagenome]|uniref:Unannotated protein n=1 Tax=freshwater metagenome TaxID=449393 RepID=A0A6J6K8X4_9ZZZZ